MYALVIGCVLNKEFINFTTGEILQVHKLHVAAVAVPSRSSKLRFFVSSNASCSAWHCHKSDCKCTEALHGKAHGSGNARLSKPRKNKGNWNWQAVAAIDWAMKRRAAESERLSQTRGLQRLLQTWNKNIRTQPKHPMSCTWRDDTSDCNLQLRLQKSSAKPWATESLQEIATETLQASRILLIRHISKSSLCQYLFGSLAKGTLTVISLRRCSWISGKCSKRSAKDGPMSLGHCESDAFALDYGIRCVHYLRHGGKTAVTFV